MTRRIRSTRKPGGPGALERPGWPGGSWLAGETAGPGPQGETGSPGRSEAPGQTGGPARSGQLEGFLLLSLTFNCWNPHTLNLFSEDNESPLADGNFWPCTARMDDDSKGVVTRVPSVVQPSALQGLVSLREPAEPMPKQVGGDWKRSVAPAEVHPSSGSTGDRHITPKTTSLQPNEISLCSAVWETAPGSATSQWQQETTHTQWVCVYHAMLFAPVCAWAVKYSMQWLLSALRGLAVELKCGGDLVKVAAR